MELEKVCKELDDLAVRYFQILDDLSERKRKVESLLKEGFLNLSKARYSMGNGAVGALQYDSNVMKALVNVHVGEEDATSTFQLNRHKPRPLKVSQSGTDSENPVQDESQTGSQVRRRKGNSEQAGESSNIQPTSDSIVLEENEESKGGRGAGDTKEDDRSLVDPLHWFGILVPSALRQGQTNFVKAVDHCVRIASLQNQLMSLQEQYKSLYKTKRKLKQEQEEEQKNGKVEELCSNELCNNDDSHDQ